MTLDGRTALSVDTKTNRSTFAASAASSSAIVPPMFTYAASDGCSSIIGTCLYAAAWKMTLGRLLGDQAVHRGAAGHVGQVDAQLAGPATLAPPRLELALQQVQRALGAIDEDQAARTDREDLARELRPDRARPTGDDHRAVPDDLLDVDGMLGDHGATQQVLDPDATDPVGVDAAVEQVGDRRHGPDLELVGQRRLHRPPDGASGGARHRDEQRRRAGRRDRRSERLETAEHAQPRDDAAGQGGVVVKEPDGSHPGSLVPQAERATSTPASPAPYSNVAWRPEIAARLGVRHGSAAALMPKRTPPSRATLSSSSIGQKERGNPSVQLVAPRAAAP